MNDAPGTRPPARPAPRALCRLDDIADGGSAALVAEIAGESWSLIAVRRGRRVFVYRNVCPHQDLPLDFTPGRFLNAQATHILCANHGALFRMDDGLCVHGPRAGRNLSTVAIRLEGDSILLVD